MHINTVRQVSLSYWEDFYGNSTRRMSDTVGPILLVIVKTHLGLCVQQKCMHLSSSWSMANQSLRNRIEMFQLFLCRTNQVTNIDPEIE